MIGTIDEKELCLVQALFLPFYTKISFFRHSSLPSIKY